MDQQLIPVIFWCLNGKGTLNCVCIAFSGIIRAEFIDNWLISILVGIPVTAIFAVCLWLLTSCVLEPLVIGWEEMQKRKSIRTSQLFKC
jgi:hypothetical protein